jgi:membrane associated rhomboid family serine protease
MGIYDRDYSRPGRGGSQPGFHLGGSTTLTTKIVIVMFIVYGVEQLSKSGWFVETFSLYPDVFVRPLHLFQLITYGFLHDPFDFRHIAFNMLGLWFLGRDVEYRYGQREYLAFFLVSIVAAGCTWVIGEFIVNRGFDPYPPMLGASGGVVAVVILFALNFPHRTVLFMFFLPMPMWVAALIVVGVDAYGAVQRSDNVAFTAHLGGALFALMYYKLGWRFERFLPGGGFFQLPGRRNGLRVVEADASDELDEPSTEQQVDEILKKIQEHGRDSLSRAERRILEEASREYQRRRPPT